MSCDNGYSVAEKLYLGHDNALVVVPYADYSEETNYDMTDITRVVVHADPENSVTTGDAIVGDSDVANYVTWNDSSGEWRIYAKVGLFPSVAAGIYNMRFTLYDAGQNVNGFVLPDQDNVLKVEVVGAP